jgi:putative SOS response-associated peptidase YedK
MINARAETVRSKPAYRAAFLHRRCLVPADGFYEWRRQPDGKRPYRIALTNEEPFAFAGLWERWQGEGGDEIESFTIIVTQANDTIRPIHDRMPVILAPDGYDLWLEGGAGAVDEAEALLKPFHSPSVSVCAYPVSTFVNNPKNDDERCIARLDEPGGRSTPAP